MFTHAQRRTVNLNGLQDRSDEKNLKKRKKERKKERKKNKENEKKNVEEIQEKKLIILLSLQ